MFLADHSDSLIIIKHKCSKILICWENADCKRTPALNMSITIASTQNLGCDGVHAQEADVKPLQHSMTSFLHMTEWKRLHAKGKMCLPG